MTTRLNWTMRVQETPEARLNPGRGDPFAVVSFDETWITFDGPEEADARAAAFTEAGRLLREAQGRTS